MSKETKKTIIFTTVLAAIAIILVAIFVKDQLTTSGVITTKESKIPCYVIPTDEELMIARKTYEKVWLYEYI